MDSQGKLGSSARQTSSIKSHCAQYHHQASRQKHLVTAKDLVIAPATSRLPSDGVSHQNAQPTGHRPGAAFYDSSSATSPCGSDVQAEDYQPKLEELKGRKPHQWRKLRCSRFRKQSVDQVAETDSCPITPEALQELPTQMDSNAYDMLKFVDLGWPPCSSSDKHSAGNRRDLDFDTILSDPLTLSINMISHFSRAAFFPSEAEIIPAITGSDPSSIRRTLCLYKLSVIGLIRQRLSEESSIHDSNIFMGIVTLAGCEFMADSPAEGRLHVEACLEIARARGGLASLSELELESLCLAEFDIAALSGEFPCTSFSEMESAIYSKTMGYENNITAAKLNGFNLHCLSAQRAWQVQEGLVGLLDTTLRINRSAQAPNSEPGDNLILRGLYAGLKLCCGQQPSTDFSSTSESDSNICEAIRTRWHTRGSRDLFEEHAKGALVRSIDQPDRLAIGKGSRFVPSTPMHTRGIVVGFFRQRLLRIAIAHNRLLSFGAFRRLGAYYIWTGNSFRKS